MIISKLTNFLIRQNRRIANWYRLRLIQLSCPNCMFGFGVVIGSNVTIKVTDGGTCKIGEGTTIKSNATIIVKKGCLLIGSNSFIGWGSVICANELIAIGDDALIAENVTIRDQNHGTNPDEGPYRSQTMSTSPITIEANVWIGAKASVLSGVKIGESAVIGANALVNKDVEAKTIVGGVPAKVIRRL